MVIIQTKMECDDNASAYESIESSLLSTSHENVNFDDENDLKPLPNTGQSVSVKHDGKFFNCKFCWQTF